MLNLFPWREQKIKKEKYFVGVVFVFVAISCCGFFIVSNNIINSKIQKTKKQTDEVIIKISAVKNATNLSQQRLNLITLQTKDYFLLQKQQRAINAIAAIMETMPENAYLNTLKLDQQGLFIDGVLLSSSDELIQQFVKHLQQRKFQYKLCKIKPIQLQKINFSFVVSCLSGPDEKIKF